MLQLCKFQFGLLQHFEGYPSIIRTCINKTCELAVSKESKATVQQLKLQVSLEKKRSKITDKKSSTKIAIQELS